MSKSDLQCSFCGKKKDQTSLLIAGIDAHICDLCIYISIHNEYNMRFKKIFIDFRFLCKEFSKEIK